MRSTIHAIQAFFFLLGMTLVLNAEANARSLCDEYSDILSPQELRIHSDGLRQPLPARYALLLHRVEVVNDSDSTYIAPHAESPLDARTPSYIGVPRGFKRLSCRMLQVAAGQASNLLANFEPPQQAFDKCFREIRDRAQCLDRVLLERTPVLDKHFEGNQKYYDEMRYWVDVAFRFVLAHEAAHVVFYRARTGPALFDPLSTEVAADLQATLAQVGSSQPDLLPVIAQFGMWSMIDTAVDWKGEQHVPMACRAATLKALYEDLLPRVHLLTRWAYTKNDFDKYRDQLKYSIGSLVIVGDTSRCGDPVTEQVKELRGDLDRIASAIDATRKFPLRDAVKTVAAIVAVPLQTDEARGLRADAIAVWSYRFISEDLEDVVSEELEDADDSEGFVRQLARARRMKAYFENTLRGLLDLVERELDARLLPSGSYARFVANNVMLRSNLGGLGASRIQSKLSIVEQYAPGSAVQPFLRGVLAFKRRDCEAGRNFFLEAIRLDPHLEDQLNNFTDPMDREECAQISRLF